MKPKIIEVDYGLGFTVTDGNKRFIQINNNLKKYPELRQEILKHELKHFHSKNKHIDFLIDLKSIFNLKQEWQLFRFSLRHPKAFLGNSPFFFDKRGFSVNWLMLLFYIFIIILGVSLVSLIRFI